MTSNLNTIPAGLTEALIYIPSKQEVLELSLGSGDNLLDEDRAEGYVDYVNIDAYTYVGSAESPCGFAEGDGGMFMTKYIIDNLGSVIAKVINYQYGEPVDYIFMGEPN